MYHPPHLTSEIMAFSQEHEKSMQHSVELYELIHTIHQITSPIEQTQKLLALDELRLKFNQELEPHFYNEEKALFPILGRYLGFDEGLSPDILNEHEKLRYFFMTLNRPYSN